MSNNYTYGACSECKKPDTAVVPSVAWGNVCADCYTALSQRNSYKLPENSPATNLPIEVEARKLISGDRREDYGEAKQSFTATASAWSAYLGHPLIAKDVALMMVMFKCLREKNKTKRDNFVDIVGYTLLAEQVKDV